MVEKGWILKNKVNERKKEKVKGKQSWRKIEEKKKTEIKTELQNT